MTISIARKIGAKQGLIASSIGLVIAQCIMTGFMSIDMGWSKAFFWFLTVDYKLNLFAGAVLLLFNGFFFGRMAGRIILIHHRNSILTGIVTGLAVLLTTAFLCGWTGFFREGLDNIGTGDDPFQDYILKPFFWIAVFGSIPACLVGALFGYSIRKAGRKHPQQ